MYWGVYSYVCSYLSSERHQIPMELDLQAIVSHLELGTTQVLQEQYMLLISGRLNPMVS